MLFSAAAAHGVRQDMELLAIRHRPQEFNRIGCPIYEQFRPYVPPGNEA
jgi:hypothetical protein